MDYDFSELDIGRDIVSLAEKQARRAEIPAKREKFRKKGVIASDLKDLESESGALFIERPPNGNNKCRMAVASGPVRPEIAYFCRDIKDNPFGLLSDCEPDSCGWVKAEMVDVKHFSFSPDHPVTMEIRCKICGNLIFEVRGRFS